MNKKFIPMLSALAMGVTMLFASACGTTGKTPSDGDNDKNDPPADDTKITYQEYDSSTLTFQDNHDKALANYNENLYYLNEWKLGYNAPGQKGNFFPDMGDPMIVYYEGYYYAYGTRGADCFHCFRSADMTNWIRLDNAFDPEPGSWGRTDMWAPDIQKIGDKWYLYYTANMKYSSPVYGRTSDCQIGVAVADTPYGPFKQYTGTNKNGETITIADTPFKGLEGHTILDQNVFQDDDGELYMYFSYDSKTGSPEHRAMAKAGGTTSEIWMVKMKDAVTWDLSTLKPLISAGYKNYEDEKRTIAWETWSPSFTGGMQCCEGPYMIKHGGKYFLTYCANSFVDAEYAVGYAVSDKPTGPFEKPDSKYLENMLLGVPGEPGTYISNRYKGFTRGTGHAAIFKTGDGNDYMFAYHAHFNREEWSDEIPNANWRALSIDYLYFDDEGNPYTNGPTYSLQRTPSDISGYTNIIGDAKVRIEGENAEYLTDNYTNRAFNTKEVIKEATFEAGKRSIEIKFDKEITVKAINIYNSCNLEKAINYIDQIDFGNGNGITGIMFNQRYINDDFIFPHSAFNIEIGGKGVTTSKIVITIDSDADFALGEIEIMGK